MTPSSKCRSLRGISVIVKNAKVGAMIHFDLNSSVIRPESYELLDEFGKAIKEMNDDRFVVAGHTDASGSDAYNVQLSLKRAKAVANYLIGRHDIEAYRISIEGYGERQPIADNGTASGRAKNRRVEFICE